MSAPTTARLIRVHTRYQFTETVRIPVAVIGTMLFPSLSLLFFVVPQPFAHDPAAATAATAQNPQRSDRPNIVLMFPDNLGWGEVGAYGGVRGVPTPNIDSIAAQGIRLDNFNVEFSCTVSRAALLTSRYAVRAAATHFA